MVRLSSAGKRKTHEGRARGWTPEDFQGHGGPKARTYVKKGVPTASASE